MAQKYGLMANVEVSEQRRAGTLKPCVICDNPNPTFSWTDYSGEGYCLRCGVPYQLKWGSDEQQREGRYPYLNVKEKAIPMLRRYFAETGKPAGLGTFMGYGEYPEVAAARKTFNAWLDAHIEEFPELRD